MVLSIPCTPVLGVSGHFSPEYIYKLCNGHTFGHFLKRKINYIYRVCAILYILLFLYKKVWKVWTEGISYCFKRVILSTRFWTKMAK